MNSRDKGARGERELSRVLRGYGYETRRGQQYCGASGDADVIGLPGIHIECKRVEKLNLYGAVDQAVQDASAPLPFEGDRIPAVFHRKDRREWLVTMRLDDWMQLYREWEAGKDIDSR